MLDWLHRASKPNTPPPASPVHRSLKIGGRDLPLRIRRLSTAKRMTLRLAPDGSEARVTLPPWGRIGDAEAFARDRADWLARQLSRIPSREAPKPGGSLPYRGRRLQIDWQAQAPRGPNISDDRIVVGGPEAGVPSRLRRWLEREALRLFAADLDEYCRRAGVRAPALRLSRAVRRWGSCAGDGTIRINWRLVMAPDAVRRAVIAHEVAHLSHFDHSPAFHAHVAQLFEGDQAAANLWLKHDGRGLYAPFG